MTIIGPGLMSLEKKDKILDLCLQWYGIEGCKKAFFKRIKPINEVTESLVEKNESGRCT